MPDVYPGDLTTRIKDLEKAVEELKAQAAGRQPLTEASKGWILRNMATPATPSLGDVHIYAQNNQLWVTSGFGTIALGEFTAADFVGPVVVTDAGGSYDSTVQGLINALKSTLNAVILELKLAGLMDSS